MGRPTTEDEQRLLVGNNNVGAETRRNNINQATTQTSSATHNINTQTQNCFALPNGYAFPNNAQSATNFMYTQQFPMPMYVPQIPMPIYMQQSANNVPMGVQQNPSIVIDIKIGVSVNEMDIA